MHPPSNPHMHTHTHKRHCSILTNVTRHLMNKELSGVPSHIKPFTSIPAVWSNKGTMPHLNQRHFCVIFLAIFVEKLCAWLRLLFFQLHSLSCLSNSWQEKLFYFDNLSGNDTKSWPVDVLILEKGCYWDLVSYNIFIWYHILCYNSHHKFASLWD